MLTNLGHSVMEAADGTKALQLLDKSPFDVMMTDLALPGMSGDEIAARAVKQQPGLRIIFATGREPPQTRSGGLKGAVFLQKPYDERQIASALNAIISLPTN
jgi:CheY-like chemotaxis protein